MNDLFRVKDKIIGGHAPCYVIAEMSANHGGSYDRAIEIIHEAKRAGADCIKIQTYTADTLTIPSSKDCFQIKMGKWKGENLHDLYQKAQTPWEWQAKLKAEAERIGLHFLSTAYDKTSVDFLENINVDFYKISSFEIVDLPLIKYVASKKKPIILSTGMATMDEIREAITVISDEGNNNLCLLKCSSAYPAYPEDMNLKTITDMRERFFNVPIGLSDHSLGSFSAVIAASLGANVIEKHFCLDRRIVTPDSSFSMESEEFEDMVDDIRRVEKCLGKISYGPTHAEQTSMIFRKSIFIVKNMERGETFTPENTRIIRPSDGLLPKYIDLVLGKKASRKIEKGTPLKLDLIEDDIKYGH